MLMKHQEKKNTELDFFFKINGGAKPRGLFSAAVQLIIITVNIIIIIRQIQEVQQGRSSEEAGRK